MKPIDEIIQLASDLISIPSTKDNPPELKRTLETTQKYLPGQIPLSFGGADAPSVLYTNIPNTTKFKILLSGHLDVVDAKPEQFKAFQKDGKLFGRGAIDMKAAAAAEILAYRDVASQVKYPLGLQLVTDEEIGGHLGVKHQAELGVIPELYICGEYSHLDIGYQSKGVLWLKITAHGKRSHGAYPWNGTNAITKLSQEIMNINKLFKVPHKEVWETTCNVGTISGGTTINQVPDSATAALDIRRIPADSTESIISQIKAGFIFSDTDIEIITDEPANTTEYKHPLIAKLSVSISSHTKNPVKYIRFNGASDARHYSALGVTAIDFGPTGEGLHGDSEWVDIHSLETYYHILKDFLLSLN